MDYICAEFNISRQAHYQKVHRELSQEALGEVILEMVRQIRRKHHKMGGRKLIDKIQPLLAAEGFKMGRDGLFDLMRQADLLVKRRKKFRPTTLPGLWRAPNLLPGLEICYPNQVWVCDITYIELEKNGYAYLFLLMDLYSRYIVGWHVSSSLASTGAEQALQMAVCHLSNSSTGTIHHSDHGVQYTSQNYLMMLKDHGIRPSMGAVGNCYDNIYAERVINTLKNEYALGDSFATVEQVHWLVPEAIQLYNTDRPHLSLNMAVPYQVFSGSTRNVKTMIIPAVESRTPNS
jgi:putative transposase